MPAAVNSDDNLTRKLAFGSMRMLERSHGARRWANLLRRSAELGVTLWHSSDEYESFELFCETYRLVCRAGFQHIILHVVKLAEPSFQQLEFDQRRLIKRVDSYLMKLGVDRINVQWMWRGQLSDDKRRLDSVSSQEAEIQSAFDQLRQEGKIGSVLPFPYTYAFAEWVLGRSWCDGLTCYLNPIEVEMLPLTRVAAATGKSILALRPLAGARAISDNRSAETCFLWTVTRP
ncbi:MAG: hypothetical protein MN733_20510, partial [Nitrososphaera sp.]|nr:hypothetical protein [Nitrososphaera sp.]